MLNQELEEEIQFHLDARAADLEKRGMSAQAAARQARMEFGSVVRYVEEAREEKGLRAWDRLRMDLREIFRGFCRRPAFALLAVLMLTAGIGSVVLTYSMMDGLVLQPLPYGQAERLFNVRTIVPKISAQYPDLPVNARHYLEWRKSCGTCESLALIGSEVLELTGSGKPRRLEAAISSRGIISTLGLKLEAGRDIEASDEGPGAKPVTLISHELWRSLAGGDLRLLGQTILLNRVATEVVGVLPEGFHLPRRSELGDMTRAPERVDLLMPIRVDLSQTPASGNFDWALIVKLREGTSLAAASGELNAVLKIFSSELMKGLTVQLEPLKDRLIGRLRRPLWLMAGAAAVLLLIACVNLGNLFRYRSIEREQSAAIRLAIGASREDIIRQSLTEILLCSFVGGLAGLMLAWAGLRWFAAIHLGEFIKPNAISLSSFAVVAGMALSLIAGFVSGVPALRRLWRCGALGLLGKEKQRRTQTRPERLARQALVSIEAGLSFVLAVFAGLLFLSYWNVKSADHGFAAEHAFTFEAATNGSHEELLTLLRGMDGVAAAGLTNALPLQGESCVRQIERAGAAKSSELHTANGRYISPGYFEAAGALILSGRGFSEADRRLRVIVISEGTSRRLFGPQNPVGEFIRYGKEGGKQGYKVIGVVADQRTSSLEAEAGATAYLPYWEWEKNDATFVVRSNLSEADAMAELQSLAKSLEYKVALGPIHHLRQMFDRSIAWRKVQTVFTATFALLGMLMASLGIIAMASEMLARRKGEIAVRMALGATREEIVRLMLWESIRPVLVGLLGGAAIVLVAGSLLEPQMYQVSVRNPWILGGLSLAIATVAGLSVYGAAVRSVHPGPVEDLRLG